MSLTLGEIMNYGLYLSASGVMSNSYRQDVIANNLANSETVGFKRDLAMFQERRTALQEHGGIGVSDPLLEHMTGGILAAPTLVDVKQGDLEPTNNPLDVAIKGDGFFTVSDGNARHLTRDGAFAMNKDGDLVLSVEPSQHVLDDRGRPIRIDPSGGAVSIAVGGEVIQRDRLGKVETTVAKIALTGVADPSKFAKEGGDLLSYPNTAQLRPAAAELHGGYVERSNVDPTLELAELMDCQRQLEANANMIKYQDTMLQELVNNVGKIS